MSDSQAFEAALSTIESESEAALKGAASVAREPSPPERAPVPFPGMRPPVRSPEVQSDRKVTFRLLAPKAEEVGVRGDLTNPQDLERLVEGLAGKDAFVAQWRVLGRVLVNNGAGGQGQAELTARAGAGARHRSD